MIRVGWPSGAGFGAWSLCQFEIGMWVVAIVLGLVAVALAWASIRDLEG